MNKAEPGAHREEKSAAMAEICSVRVGETQFGIPISHILEIIGGARPQPVPLAPPYVGGLVHYRGDVLTTFSLRHLLDLPRAVGSQDILVLEGSDGCFGVLVDSVAEVLTISRDAFEPNPSILDERRRSLLDGAFKLDRGLLVMLDPARLDPRWSGETQAA